LNLSIRSQHCTGTIERRKHQLEYFLIDVLHDFSIF
jgi:hypothetical protein